MVRKNNNKKNSLVLTLVLRSASLQWDIPLWQLFLRILYLFDCIFSGILWIAKLHYFHQGTMVTKETGKRQFLVIIAMVATG